MKKIDISTKNYYSVYALVDDDDYERVTKYKWFIHYNNKTKLFYVKSGNKKLHRFIMNTPEGMVCDHIDHDTLDNRKSNLRNCSYSENSCNSRRFNKKFTSRFKGVTWVKDHKSFRAMISKNGIKYNLGYFKNEIDAGLAYNKKAKELHGDFAYLNEV